MAKGRTRPSCFRLLPPRSLRSLNLENVRERLRITAVFLSPETSKISRRQSTVSQAASSLLHEDGSSGSPEPQGLDFTGQSIPAVSNSGTVASRSPTVLDDEASLTSRLPSLSPGLAPRERRSLYFAATPTVGGRKSLVRKNTPFIAPGAPRSEVRERTRQIMAALCRHNYEGIPIVERRVFAGSLPQTRPSTAVATTAASEPKESAEIEPEVAGARKPSAVAGATTGAGEGAKPGPGSTPNLTRAPTALDEPAAA